MNVLGRIAPGSPLDTALNVLVWQHLGETPPAGVDMTPGAAVDVLDAAPRWAVRVLGLRASMGAGWRPDGTDDDVAGQWYGGMAA